MEANIWKILIILISCGACNCIYRRTSSPVHRGGPYPHVPHEQVQKTVYVSYSNMCILDYEKHVEDKPDILATISNRAGLCRIRSQENRSRMCYVKEVLLEYIYFVGNIGFFRPSSPDEFDQPYRRVVGRERNLTTSVMLNGLSYDAREESIFYLATQHHNHLFSKIHKINVSHSTDYPEAIFEQREHELTDLAYDWITKNMYISGRTFVSVVNANKTWSVAEVISYRSDIQSLAVHPNKGYLFFVDRKYISSGDESNVIFYAIYRSNLDGSNIVKLSPDINQTLTSLGIDYYTDRLYWALPNSSIIQHAKLDGSDVKDILEKPINGGSHSMSFDKKYVYYVQAVNKWVGRFNKTDHKDDKDYKLTSIAHPMADIKIYDAESQKIRDGHPCLNNNGGCHQYCFAIPKDNDKLERVCSCSIKKTLSSDGVSCESTRTSE